MTSTPACLIDSGPIGFFNYNVTWWVTSLSSDTVRMVRVKINWPGDAYPKPRLNNIQVDSIDVWTGKLDTPPVEVCEASEGCSLLFNAGLPGDRQLFPGQTVEIKFVFSHELPSGDYAVDATFLNITAGGKCTASSSVFLP